MISFGACLALLAGPAHATLARSHDSVDQDRVHLGASRSTRFAASYTVDTLTLANGGVVKEFVGANGTVFAVAWRGPGRPDLRQLLGAGFATFQSSTATPGGRRVRRPLEVNRAELVVHSAGHPGGFWGFAYVPAMTPSGFSLSELR